MSAEAQAWVLRHSRVDKTAFLVHLMIADTVNEQHGWEFWANQSWLADKCRVERRTIGRALADLEVAGHLRRVRDGRGKRVRYALIMGDAETVWDSNGPATKCDNPPVETCDKMSQPLRQNVATPATKSDTSTQENSNENEKGTASDSPDGSPTPDDRVADIIPKASDTVHDLVAGYATDFRDSHRGRDPDRRWILAAAREASKALAQDVEPDAIRRCLAVIAKENKQPGVLASVLADYHTAVPA